MRKKTVLFEEKTGSGKCPDESLSFDTISGHEPRKLPTYWIIENYPRFKPYIFSKVKCLQSFVIAGLLALSIGNKYDNNSDTYKNRI